MRHTGVDTVRHCSSVSRAHTFFQVVALDMTAQQYRCMLLVNVVTQYQQSNDEVSGLISLRFSHAEHVTCLQYKMYAGLAADSCYGLQ